MASANCECIPQIGNGNRINLRNPHKFAESIYFCVIRLQLRKPELLANFSCCGIRDKTIVPTKFTLQVFVRRIHGNFVGGVHSHFGTCLNISLWNQGTYRHKIVLLSSAQLGLVMFLDAIRCISECWENVLFWEKFHSKLIGKLSNWEMLVQSETKKNSLQEDYDDLFLKYVWLI